MPDDELADEASQLTINGDDTDGSSISFAAKRLALEARETLSFGGSRGISDVTEDFAAAAKLLQRGQLVKDDYFTLFEAVGALEIMDPKMDSGYIPPDNTLDPDFDVCKGLSAEKVLWIMDELLRLTVVWHDGYPISQTVFTSLHIDRLLSPDNRPPYYLSCGEKIYSATSTKEQLVHVVLRPYCIALVKTCALVLHTIQSQNFYEEEDFVTHLFGRELLPSTGADCAVKLVDEALDSSKSLNLDSAIHSAICERLQFVRNYIALLMGDLTDWVRSMAMEPIARTHTLAWALPEAFSDKVQRHLATSTPPRPMDPISWEEALQRWKRLCADVTEAERLTAFEVCQSPHALQRAAWAFAYREPQPKPFARATLQSMLFAGEQIAEGITFFDLLLTDMRDLVLAGSALADPQSFLIETPADLRHKCSRVMEAFMDKAFDEYMNLYRMVCQNRCRIRRTFTQSVTILDNLEREAMRADTELDSITPGATLTNENDSRQVRFDPLTSWTKHYKLLVIGWTIQLGFETDIYLQHELCIMYWYLMVFAERRRKVLEHIGRFLRARLQDVASSRHVRQYAEVVASLEWLAVLCRQADLTIALSLALWQLTGLLTATSVMEPPKRDYAEEQLLHDVRMKSYLAIAHDPIPTLEDYRTAERTIVSVQEVCASADRAITDARGCLTELKRTTPQQGKYVGTEEQWKREMKQLETTCVAVAVQISQLHRIAEKHGKQHGRGELKAVLAVSIPPPGSRYHDWWVVPRVEEVMP